MNRQNPPVSWHIQRILAALSNKTSETLQALGLLPALAALLKRLIWAPVAVRDELQRNGVNIVPAHFYSSIPSIDEVRNSFEYLAPGLPYLDTGIFDHDLMLGILEKLTPYAAEFSPPQEDDENHPAGFFWGNSQFSHSDAMSYYAMIRHLKPQRILEVGSGFSTLVASEALTRNGSGEIICIEPYPRSFLDSIPHLRELVREAVQQMNIEFFNDTLNDGDILFIDSTHTVKTGSDCLHLYLKILPALRKRVFVHVHDIFLPEAMPKAWALEQQIYWTEQYLLLAYLLDNSRITVWFGSHYHLRQNRNKLTEFMFGQSAAGGGSFWFELRPPLTPGMTK